MSRQQFHSTWIEIDLEAVRNNVSLIKESTGVDVLAIVKANAYSHGAVPVARAALEAGATWLGVARVSELLELRSGGISAPVLMLGYVPPLRLEEVIDLDCVLTVWSCDQLEEISAAAARMGKYTRVHIKVDTGMSRLGVQAQNAIDLVRSVEQFPGVVLEGLFTHFARADELDATTTNQQEALFDQVLRQLEAENLRPPLVHASNSAASLTRPSAHYSLVRLGNAMYGLHPSPECQNPSTYQAALSWKSYLGQVKMLEPGRGLSYGHNYTTSRHERIGTVPVGYADGYRRIEGNQVLVGGKLCPVVGRVCMDYILVQLDEVPDAQAGDEVVLIGKQGDAVLSAENVAKIWGTINYEVVCVIGARVSRYFDNA
jgi:alanine racemase